MLRRFATVAALGAVTTILAACPSSPPVAVAPPPVVAPAPPPTPPAPAAPAVRTAADRLAEIEHQYLDGLFAAKPHLAMFMGDHRFDGRHVDLSEEAFARRREEIASQRHALEAISEDALSVDDRVDAAILHDGLELERLYLDEIKEWEWDPRLNDSFPYYDPREMVAERLTMLIHGDFAPLETRLASLTEELQGLPRLLSQAQALLKRPPGVYTEHAIDDNKGRIDLVKGAVAAFIKAAPSAGAPPAAAVAAEAARVSALAALVSFQNFLEKKLLPRSDGDYRLGRALYRKKFPLALQTDSSPEDVVARAQEDFRQARAELYDLALDLHAKLMPGKPIPAKGAAADPATQKRIINEVRDALSKDHPTAADYVANEWRSLEGLRSFIKEKDLLDLPPVETLKTEEMPAFKRGVIAAEYLAPGMLDAKTEWRATYTVDPIDPRWPAAKVESYLRANNRYEAQLRAVHEAYPGHHVQTWYARKSPSPLRAVLWNAAMVEGWAVYGEDVMVKLGLGGAENDRYRFFSLRGHLRVDANAILDIQLQSGTMTEEEAVKFMTQEGFQEKANAEKKLVRAELDSTQLCQYFLGHDEIVQLEKDYRAKIGDVAYKQRTFDEALVSHGSVAVKHLRRYLLGQ